MSQFSKLYIFLMLAIDLFTLIGCGSSTGNSTSTTTTPPPAVHNEWVWKSGSSAVNQPGNYGTKGEASANAVPPGRFSPTAWTDASGDFWLFGGYSSPSGEDLSDLWEYSGGMWRWVGGPQKSGQVGIYGVQGVAAAANIPGARSEAVGWVDKAGNFWLFGGFRTAPILSGIAGTGGIFADLWKYSHGGWTWVRGSNQPANPGLSGDYQGTGVYGTKGEPASTDYPGARYGASAWTDSAGNLWLFGGQGVDSQGNLGELNDLWKYDIATNQWTWMSGSDLVNQPGIYGNKGVAASTNTPGARAGAVAVSDQSGNLWLFGGDGADANDCNDSSPPCDLNDLWKYNTTANEWTWVSGSNLNNQPGTYGQEGQPAAANVPPPRDGAVGWMDSAGDLWIFGGISGTQNLNDLWKYDFSTNEWTWMNGTGESCPTAVYGTEGVAAPSNVPGGRDGAAAWIDASGNLWFFGGDEAICNGPGTYNDLWEYEP